MKPLSLGAIPYIEPMVEIIRKQLAGGVSWLYRNGFISNDHGPFA